MAQIPDIEAVAADHVLRGDGEVLAPGWVGVRAGRIVEVASGRPPGEVHVRKGGAGSVLLPGLVSAHTHLAYGDLPGLGVDRSFYEWLTASMLGALKGPAGTPQAQLAGALRSARRLLRSGVTCVGESGPGVAGAEALRRTGLRGLVFAEVFGSLSPWLEEAWESAETLFASLEALASPHGWGIAPHTPWTCPPALLERSFRRARAEGRRVTLHLEESHEERAFFLEGTGPLHELMLRRGTLERYEARLGRSPTAGLDAAGLLGPDLLATHCVQIDADGVDRLARSGAHVVHCPTSNARLGEGVAPVHELLEAGVPVSLGTDSVASNERFDLFEEMRLAVLLQRARLGARGPGQRARPTPTEAVRMATMEGARALGLGAICGRLEVGLEADLLLLEPDPLRGPDPLPPEVFVALAAGPSDVSLVTVAGRVAHDRHGGAR